MWTVYMLACADNTLYTGITKNLAERLAKHNAGTASKYTRSRLPVTVAWSITVSTESAARTQEAALKKQSRTEKLALIKNQN